MNEIKKQVTLIRGLRQIRNEYRELKLSYRHFRYLGNFLKDYKWLVSGLIILLLAQGLIEAALIIFSRNQLSGDQQLLLAPFFWRWLFLFLVVFFVCSYFSIRQEKTFVVLLANRIRRRLFRFYINKPQGGMTQKDKADLIAKISYHLPLVSTGVSNTLFGALRWLLCLLVVVWISFLAGLNWLLILAVSFVVSILIGIAAYFIARRYISQEVTFYSQMIRHVDMSLSDKDFLKVFNQESSALKDFDRLIDFDSFFRIRRDLWMRLGSKVVFAVTLLVSVLAHFYYQDFSSWIGLVNTSQRFLFLFLMIYFSRSLYEALRVGLYSFPARLGLFLTITRPGIVQRRVNILEPFGRLIFSSRKTKLFKEDRYRRNLKFEFLKGERVLITGDHRSGKSILAGLFAGGQAFNSKALKVKIDNQRLDFSDWQKFGRGLYFFDPNFRSERSLMEFIAGKDKADIDILELNRILDVCNAHQELLSLAVKNGNFNQPADSALASPSASFAVQTLHCLVNKPNFIVVDNLWPDLGYPEIKKALELISSNLLDSVIVVFSSLDNGLLKYSNKYIIDSYVKK